MDVSRQNQTSCLCCFVDTTSFVLLSTHVYPPLLASPELSFYGYCSGVERLLVLLCPAESM